MNQVDALLLVLLVPFALRGWVRGVLREAFGVVGFVSGVIAASARRPRSRGRRSGGGRSILGRGDPRGARAGEPRRGRVRRGDAPAPRAERGGPLPVPHRENAVVHRERRPRVLPLLRLWRARRPAHLRVEDPVARTPGTGPPG